MYIKKSTMTVVVCFAVGAAVVGAGFVLKANSQKCVMENTVKYAYQQSIAEVAEGLANMDYALQKALAVKTPSSAVALSAEIWREAGMAEMSLEALPTYGLRLEGIMKFFHQTGEYALYLAKRAVNGTPITEEEAENLRALSEQAKTLATAMTELEYRIQTENSDLNGLNAMLTYIDDPSAARTEGSATPYEYTNPLMEMESEMQMPELNYEGEYSSHLAKTEYKFLEDKDGITREEARRRAAYILGCEPKDLNPGEDVISREIRLYCFSGRNMDICVTEAEGYPFTFSKNGVVADAKITDEEALAIGEKYLKKMNFSHMEPLYSAAYGNVLLAEFVYCEDGVPCLTDKITLGIALDTGEIKTFDASEYVKNHVTGRDVSPEISYEEALSKLSDGLTVTEGGLVVMGTNSYEEPERLCYEFSAETEQGNGLLIYINAKNGVEEGVELIFQNENGSYILK